MRLPRFLPARLLLRMRLPRFLHSQPIQAQPLSESVPVHATWLHAWALTRRGLPALAQVAPALLALALLAPVKYPGPALPAASSSGTYAQQRILDTWLPHPLLRCCKIPG